MYIIQRVYNAQTVAEMNAAARLHAELDAERNARTAESAEFCAKLKARIDSEEALKKEMTMTKALNMSIRAMTDFILECTGSKEKDLVNTLELSGKAKAFWCSQWLNHAVIMGDGMARPMDAARGTVRNSGITTAHAALVSVRYQRHLIHQSGI
ncbi:hypothetical protein TWF281_010869 [Arthrobotrys megalospora]